MTTTEALVKLRDDIISWCTLNFKKKADTSTTNEMKAKLDTLEAHPTYTGYTPQQTERPTMVTVDSLGHVTCVQPVECVGRVTCGTTSGISIANVTQNESNGDGATFSINAPTLTEHCASEYIVLSSKQYGIETPSDPVEGQLFFLKVEE